jgi:hypothetical protein
MQPPFDFYLLSRRPRQAEETAPGIQLGDEIGKVYRHGEIRARDSPRGRAAHLTKNGEDSR